MATTKTGQTDIRYVAESTPGTTPTDPAMLLFSNEVQRVSVFLDKDLQESMDVGNDEVHEFFSARSLYGMEVEYHLYRADEFFDFADRTASGPPTSYTLDLITQKDGTDVYTRATGMYPSTVRLSGGVGQAYTVTVTFTGGQISDPTTSDPGVGAGSREATQSGESLITWASGAITVGGSAVGTLHESFEVTIDHNLEAGYTTGDADPVAAGVRYGARTVSGTCTFSLDDGGDTEFLRTDALTQTDIVVPFGTTTGDPKVTFANAVWPRFEYEITADMDVLMTTLPWRSTSYTEGTV